MGKLENLFNKVKRKFILLYMTNGSGKVKIIEDKVLCYVNKKSLNHTFNTKKYYNICLGGNDNLKLDSETEDYFRDKPIYYIFDGITFDKGVRIDAFFTVNVIFRNCVFNDYVEISGVNNIVFENNKYNCNRKVFFSGYGRNIKFVNDNLVNGDKDLSVNMKFDNIEIVNSSINVNEGDISFKSKKIVLDNAVIECSSMDVESDDITYKYSSVIDAKRKIVINNKSNSFDFNSVFAPIMINNGYIVKEKEKVDKDVVNARGVLINQLKGISKLFSSINSNDLNRIEDKINNRSIGKIRKK